MKKMQIQNDVSDMSFDHPNPIYFLIWFDLSKMKSFQVDNRPPCSFRDFPVLSQDEMQYLLVPDHWMAMAF